MKEQQQQEDAALPRVTWWVEPEQVREVGFTPAQEEPASVEQQLQLQQEEQRVPSRHRHKKFQQHFKMIPPHERLLACSYCSYGGERILQGHLYITQNYFAFRSNVFGYVTKLIIPASSVTDIRREKLARIIPNTVVVTTQNEKHVFSFLRFRKSTYSRMVDVWKNASTCGYTQIPEADISANHEGDADESADDSSLTSSENSSAANLTDCDTHISPENEKREAVSEMAPLSSCQEKLSLDAEKRKMVPSPDAAARKASYSPNITAQKTSSSPNITARKTSSSSDTTTRQQVSECRVAPVLHQPRTTLMLKLCVGLVVLLSMSSVYLMYRIGCIYFTSADVPTKVNSDKVYQKILEWQTHTHEQSASTVQQFLSSYLSLLSKVNKSLDILSLREVVEEEHPKA